MEEIIEFLRESNNIENVFDDVSLEQAIYAWLYLEKQKEMKPHVILRTHKILMLHSNLMPNEKGYFREMPVYIGKKEFLDWKEIEEAVKVWSMNAWISPDGWREHHIKFEQIHPFIDGNGRVGRMLLNWERKKAGLPILVIKAIERETYYKWFK